MPVRALPDVAGKKTTTGIERREPRHRPPRVPLRAPLRLAALAAGAWFHAAAHAQDASAPTEELFLGEVPIVLSVTRLAQPPSETPASVTIITRDMIEASGVIDIPDLLRLVPGFQVAHGDHSSIAATYHGLGDLFARRLQVLVDGRSVYTAATGGVQWNELPLAIEDIDRIEVVRGPNGVAFGANAFVAVVNIITLHSSQAQGGYVKATSGDPDLRKLVARAGGHAGDLDYRVTAGYRQDSGFPNDIVDSKIVRLFTFRGDLRATTDDNVEFQAGVNGGPRGNGDIHSTSNPPRDQTVDSSFQQLRWQHTLNATDDYSLLFYHNYFHLVDDFLIASPPFPLPAEINQSVTAERFDLEFQHRLALGASTRLVWGLESREDRAKAPGFFDSDDYVVNHSQRLFFNTEWRPSTDWIVNAGDLYEHNDTTGSDTSPRLGVNYHLTPEHTVRASASRAFRMPSQFENFADTVVHLTNGTPIARFFDGNAALNPEKITSYELGYIADLRQQNLALDVKLFREHIRDIISGPVDASILNPPKVKGAVFRNDGSADVNGAETQIKYRPTHSTQIIYSFAYAQQQGQMLTHLNPTERRATDDSTPLRTQSLLLMQRLPWGFEASATWYRVSDIQWLDQSANDRTAYEGLDVRLAWKIRAGNTRTELSVVGQNLLNSYFDYREQLVFDRRILFNASIQLR